MKDRSLTILVFFFALVLGVLLFTSERSVSQVMESIGDFISGALGV
jgi:hypothetical protein